MYKNLLGEEVIALSDEQLSDLKQYLLKRCNNEGKEKKISVVFDLLHQCDISCRGCGTNAKMVNCQSISDNELKYEQIQMVLDKIKKFVDENKLAVFINFGGGEPFLREDIVDIIKYASELFGSENIGIDTNASLEQSYQKILSVMDYLSYVGVSINGLHDYHNWWANNNRIDAFNKATDTVKKLCENPEFAEKLEVTTVVTQKNIDSIPELMDFLHSINVKNYSVHRPIPVGRMKYVYDELAPSIGQYFSLLLNIVECSKKLNMHAHMHHSIEGIYGSLVGGINTYYEENLVNTNYRSSIGIEPNGDVVVDPWCTVDFWQQLKMGNILEDDTELRDIFNANGELLQRLKQCISKQKRCDGCSINCSGGSRIVAAATQLYRLPNEKIDLDTIFQAMTAKDPACPLTDKEYKSI